ncbi:PaaI family thioesterase [Cognatiyoonia sp. IB215182]|uniref:PaaI family thioesterase n=1 Tax=Cognatiyoonia sp. IB215182 TaxID=3097353 RepID=UPI002A1435B4|nr:PaaI family thioesterase [Cognatiyoonia sp. IB215182]MDX8353792.1 PaaI family thioesterase [Cognatiyoonia sp. IB215182]
MNYRNPEAVARMRADFDRQGAMAAMGITVGDVAPGRVVLEMPFNADFGQHHGFMHAGVITTAMDSACGFAAFTLMEADAEVLTVEFKCNFMAPAKGDAFRFEGNVVKAGRTLTFTEGRAVAIDAGQEKVVATISATMMAVRGLQ